MLNRRTALAFAVSALLFPAALVSGAQSSNDSIGQFASQQDIGTVLHAGSTHFDAAKGTYTISGSGDNVWFTSDDLQFVWKKVEGDVSLERADRFCEQRRKRA